MTRFVISGPCFWLLLRYVRDAAGNRYPDWSCLPLRRSRLEACYRVGEN